MRGILLALLLLAAPARAQDMAAARPMAVVDGETIRLADLFDHAGPRGEAVLGAAPAPGRRIIIEAAQLAAIARIHGIAWRPLGANERVIVERPGRPVTREALMEPLRAELLALGMDADSELEIPGLIPPMVPVQALVQIAYEGSHFDPATQRFSTTLVILAEGQPSLRNRLAGRALPTLPVVVATRRMVLGEVVGAGDAQLIRVRAERVRPGTASRLEEAVGKQLRRPMGTGIALMSADLGPPALVGRNEPVTLIVEAPGLSLAAAGRAMETGAMGQIVPVMNLASRLIVEGRVIGPGRVRVTPGAAPLQQARLVDTAP
ncbi:flagellar basal body P-ring formation chaperone FlgA [Plastoroseomonas arctica]|uniref:Flagellar basal body P-ring formation protein FlgA n=1 Tax=Plastoroseomonas arctica TaxID=1509237 RepID=A0AAF1JZ71_9PROT|nr:flagellar basal body P-ring formation chaperone FlgA [Plastoroseomonas arctica]MBR0657572.1 flagellar basal body P-ring formation protein FlgA [Plastoroseomonas arctica]